jgi:hypothetical protein
MIRSHTAKALALFGASLAALTVSPALAQIAEDLGS